MNCIKCGDTGIKSNGDVCDCGKESDIVFPNYMSVPIQYQDIHFSKEMLPSNVKVGYGAFMEQLLNDCINNVSSLCKNTLICAPPNTGKSVFTYTVYGALYAKGVPVPDFCDILEVRQLMMNIYKMPNDKESILYTAPLAIVKIPMDLPSKMAETMSTLVERRVRFSGSTIFLYSGSKDDLLSQDTFGKLRLILGDGSYNSVEIKDFNKEKTDGT